MGSPILIQISSHTRQLTFAAFLLLGTSAVASAAEVPGVPPGTYVTTGGWGNLTIRALGPGTRSFDLETVGINSHVCSLQGIIRGRTGSVEENGNPEKCSLTFTVKDATVSVVSPTRSACHYNCGDGASFEADFHRTPEACRPAAREEQRRRFLKEYRAKHFFDAHAILGAYYRACGDLLNWVEVDRVRNDLAITEFHMGRPEQCLATLKDTRAVDFADVEAMGGAFRPSDFHDYLPVAQATWHNLRLCQAGKKGPP